MIWVLIETIAGEAQTVNSFTTWADCMKEAARGLYINDGFAGYVCEVTS